MSSDNRDGERTAGETGRGELRIYLGAAPGVGKTYAMLGEAHRRRERGCDVVVAVVQTYGREHTTAQLGDLEVIAPKIIDYRGTRGAELDVDAVLARRPALVLVDELAHTNTPGSANDKRWQDVEQLLAAGIDVLTTLNIQHLESLSDVVQHITGVTQPETVPDEIVRTAAQVELVDITPEALRRRLSHGNIYTPDKVDAALGNYFRQGNLTALRELALLWVADQVDAALTKYRAANRITDTWEARERVVVAVTGGPESETLVRRASRIASRSSAELIVVHVVRGDGRAGVSAPEMGKVRALAASLGASLHSVVGDDVPATLLDFARAANATQLVLGTSRRSRWARIVDEGIGVRVVQQSGSIDVHLVTYEEASRPRRVPPVASRSRTVTAWLAAVLVPGAAAAVMSLVDRWFGIGGEGALFFIVVLVVSLLGGVAPAALSALASGLLLNYFFTPPVHSFTIAEPDNFIITVVLLVVAVAVAVLVDSAAQRTREARRASQEAELLALFAGSVLRGAGLAALLEKVRETYGQDSVSMLSQEDGLISSVGPNPATRTDDADTVCAVTEGEYALALRGPEVHARDRRVLLAVANQAVGLIRQSTLAQEAGKARTLAEADRLRRSLLSAVSHDLRTPLAAVKAAASSLRSDDVDFSPEDTAELLATIEESADALTALVGNLLDSSRLAAGVVTPTLRPVYLDEVVHEALMGLGIDGRTGTRVRECVQVDVGSVAAMADPGLLERVIANLVDNALRYGGDSVVRVGAGAVGERTLITVADTGPGIPRGQAERMFAPFQRSGDRDTTTGVGLGLSVVRGFVDAMGGSISATDTPGGGLTMIVELAGADTRSG
ncbi:MULTISPECIES: sensor histidine kinase [Rhodococcus]|uniref:histidine kinase n=1 Tax=Rhodococcus opacus RKJ300 = JCM 13270 TaxID=1165867 RepID=I0WMW6_RHOOP|nr:MULTISPECIES: sensor histidine kinase KdpD [Rhodococcus]EID77732.1 histidine sensor kinase, two-component system [Rhodococcus opacus RKJ300 = JCM 13270]